MKTIGFLCYWTNIRPNPIIKADSYVPFDPLWIGFGMGTASGGLKNHFFFGTFFPHTL
jgi:hypothetical protein